MAISIYLLPLLKIKYGLSFKVICDLTVGHEKTAPPLCQSAGALQKVEGRFCKIQQKNNKIVTLEKY
jgi:hypothetical protein